MPAFTTSPLGYDSAESTPGVLVSAARPGGGKGVQIAKEEVQPSLFAHNMVIYTLPYIKILNVLRNVFLKIH